MAIVLLFCLAFFKAAFYSNLGFGLVDEGQILHNGLKILEGGLPYRDFFAVFPPLHYYFYSLPSLIFGPSILAPRLLSSLVFAFTPVFIYLIVQKMTLSKIALIPAILIIFLNVNVERLYFFTPLLIAIYVAQRSQFFWSGLLFGVSALFRLDITMAFIVAACLTNFKNSPKIILGFVIPLFGMLLWLYTNGILADFWQNTVIDAVAITRKHDLPLPLSFTNVQSAYLTFYFGLILVSYLWSLRYKNLLFWQIAAVLLLPYMLGRTDMGHLIKGGLPFLFIGAYLLNKIPKFLANILVFGLFLSAITESLFWLKFNDMTLYLAKDKLQINSQYIPGSTLPSVDTLKQAVDFSPDLTLPYMAGIYYLVGKTSPTRYDNILYGYLDTATKEEEFVQKIANSNIQRVIYDPLNGPKTIQSSFANYNPRIHKYLLDNYNIIETSPEGWLFLSKK